MKYAVAIGNIKPAEFWELTLAEFNVMMDAYIWNDYQDRAKLAQHAQWEMSSHRKSKQIPSIEKMIGKSPEAQEQEKEEKVVTTKEDIDEMKRSMGI
ncbi:hypothetical protein [Salinicoccus albus]|uniref:hypothetical protein n=1 Tax=Salinicoccus albus TaxID=418756 RepID=UPI00037860C5|nr:hypothetical protein [Salinicoccus albus]